MSTWAVTNVPGEWLSKQMILWLIHLVNTSCWWISDVSDRSLHQPAVPSTGRFMVRLVPLLIAAFTFSLRKYITITALEQRQQYKDDFCSEYDEYRVLHDRIGAITEMFVQLGSKINMLSPGTQEYKVLSERGASGFNQSEPEQIQWMSSLTPVLRIFSAYGRPNTTKVPKV